MVPNPESSAETLYLPIGRYGALNEPSLLVTTMRSKPVSTFLIVTVTPGIDPPDLSVTVPFIVPVTVCAATGMEINTARTQRTMHIRRDTTIFASAFFRFCRRYAA